VARKAGDYFNKGLALELVVQGGLLCLGGLSSWLDLSILSSMLKLAFHDT